MRNSVRVGISGTGDVGRVVEVEVDVDVDVDPSRIEVLDVLESSSLAPGET